jgi:hypothetical protein
MKQLFVIQPCPHPARTNAIDAVRNAPEGMVITIAPKTRSSEQNALLHKLLSEIAKRKEFGGKKRTAEQWKLIMVSGHSIATGRAAEVVPGLEGEFLNLRESTASMSVKRLSSLVEYVQAWSAENGVEF